MTAHQIVEANAPRLENTYASLPGSFFQRLDAQPVSAPRLIALNEPLARELGLDPHWLRSAEGVAMLAGNAFPPGATPIAQAYAGHQFGGFSPQLGDGRALLIGEVVDSNNLRRDIQLKGSGPTRFSRNGDGRAALGPMLREYIVSEAFAALGIPTTRALAVVSSGDTVYRETAKPGAILTRVAASHIRVGTFQFFAARGDIDGLKALTSYAISRHYPDLISSDNQALALLAAVIERQASLIARWMLVGFIHGVMNTDNMAISGETIDYGPCAFMDAYHPRTVFSSIDHQGRYAYANQPGIAVWNLARLAEALLPLIDPDENRAVELAQAELAKFQHSYEAAWHAGLRSKIGLVSSEDGDLKLISDLLDAMAQNGADFTQTFRSLADDIDGPGATRDQFIDPTAFDAWSLRWRERLAREPVDPAQRRAAMNAVNPRYIPRNHRVEQAIRAAEDHGDFSPFETLVSVAAKPFDEQPEFADYANPPLNEERVLQTFCGT
jgi:uncharacterized protein YdiU (UPF0061 family)